MADGSLPVGSNVEVVLAPEPFTTRVERLEAQEGATIALILTEACLLGALDPQDLCRVEVFLDGVRLVDRDAALDLCPAPGQMLNICVLPAGGGGGGGNKLISTLLTVALIAATAWIAGPAALGFGSLAGASGLSGVALTAVRVGALAAVSLGGSALLSAINAPQRPTQHFDLEGQSNQARRAQPMPLCLGKRRWSFDLASSAYSTFAGDDTFVTAIYALHYGPCTLTDIKIGETLITAYPAGEIQTETFLVPGPRASTLYPTDIHQDTFQNQLDRLHGNYTTATTVDGARTAELDFYWPGGLYYPKSDGSTVNCDQTLTIEISPYGAGQWTAAPGVGSTKVSANQKTPKRLTLVIPFAAPGKFDIRVRRNSKLATDRDVDDVIWTSLRTPRPGQPVLDQNLSILVVRAKASQDFSGALGVVSGIIEPVVPVCDGQGNWQGDPTTFGAGWAASSNAAELLRYVMTGYPAAKPLAAAEIDVSLAEQRQLIEANSWGASVLINGADSQQDAAKKLGAAGRFSSYWNGSKLAASPDWIKVAPRQMFVGRNASGFRRTRSFPDPVHAMYVTFPNSGHDWKDDGLYVYNDGYDATNAKLVETLQLEFACSPERAHREGRVHLARRIDGVFAYEWTAAVDALVATLGDRVRARRTSALYDQTDARVLHRVWSGSLVAGVRLDVEFGMTSNDSYALDVRTPTKMLMGLPLTSVVGPQRTVMFAAPLAADQAPGKGDLVALGRVDHVTEDVEIIDIDPQSDRTVSIKARNYIGPAIRAAETGPIPPLATFLTTRDTMPAPRVLGVIGTPDGIQVDFEVKPQRSSAVRGFTARWRFTPAAGETSTWNSLPQLGATARRVTTPPFPDVQREIGDTTGVVTADVQIRTNGANGEVSPWTEIDAIVLTHPVAPVEGFAVVGVVRSSPDGRTFPAIAVSATARPSGDITDLVIETQVADDATAVWKAAGTFPADNPVGDIVDGVQSATVYDVRARWRSASGWSGDYVYLPDINVPDAALVATRLEGQGALATLNVVDGVRLAAATGGNGLVDTDFNFIPRFWCQNYDVTGLASPTAQVNFAGKAAAKRQVNGTPGVGQEFAIGQGYGGRPIAAHEDEVRLYALPCRPGEKIEASAFVSCAGLQRVNAEVYFWDKNGTSIQPPQEIGPFITDFSALANPDGGQSAMVRPGGFTSAPAHAAYCTLDILGFTDGSANPYLIVQSPVLRIAQYGAVELAAFTPGVGDQAADVTGKNTAAAIQGQGAGATATTWSFVGPPTPGTINLSNIPRVLLPGFGGVASDGSSISAGASLYAGGATVQSLQPATAAADRTANATAANVAGQGALATANAAAWGSQVSGVPDVLSVGPVDVGGGSYRLPGNYLIAGPGDLRTLQGFFPATAAADRTANATAANVAGQGPLATAAATLSSITSAYPNLVYNGGLRLGSAGWSLEGATGISAPGTSIGDGPYLFMTGNGTRVNTSRVFYMSPGFNYTLQAEVFTGGLNGGNFVQDLVGLNSGGAVTFYSARITRSNKSTSWTQFAVTFSPPDGTVAAYIRVFTEGATISGSICAVRKIKVALASEASVFSDDGTTGALYDDQTSIQALKPQEAGANVTERRVAVSFNGQGALAVLNAINSGQLLPISTSVGQGVVFYPKYPLSSTAPGKLNVAATAIRFAGDSAYKYYLPSASLSVTPGANVYVFWNLSAQRYDYLENQQPVDQLANANGTYIFLGLQIVQNNDGGYTFVDPKPGGGGGGVGGNYV